MSAGIVIIVVIGIILVAVITYFIMSHLKGSIKLALLGTSFSHGDTIAGSFTLHAKKSIEGNRLSVSLVAHEKIVTKDDEGKKTTQSSEIFRNENTIEGSKEYPQGFNDTFAFELKVPDSKQGEFEGSKLGQAVKFIGNLLDNERKTIEWSIEARLDAKGIDLTDSQKIYIDLAESR